MTVHHQGAGGANNLAGEGSQMTATRPYIVWSPSGEAPAKVTHPTHKAAHYAAQIMAKAHPGQSFFVMKRNGREIVASVGTHPEGRDGEAGSVRSMGDAVTAQPADAQPPVGESAQ